ncbi:hypothetical protein V2J09_013745 [Rumex salicifolius]
MNVQADASQLENGYLDTTLDWIPSMKDIRLKDLPTFIRTTDPNDIMLNYLISTMERSRKASAIIFNTFEALEGDFLAALAPDFPPLFSVGPIHKLINAIQDDGTESIGSNLWKEDQSCMEWLDTKDAGSVVYVNFGSITVMTNDQLVEFAFGLANSGKHFLWVIRPDLVTGDSAVLPVEFVEETKERSLLVGWCDQEKVLNHVAVGGFLTHCGWNSMVESVCAGVPMITWPFFAEQQTNCWASCEVWGIGMEIDSDVKRENVERQVSELMDGDKGKEMKRKTMELKKLGEKAIAKGTGDSWKNLEKLITQLRRAATPDWMHEEALGDLPLDVIEADIARGTQALENNLILHRTYEVNKGMQSETSENSKKKVVGVPESSVIVGLNEENNEEVVRQPLQKLESEKGSQKQQFEVVKEETTTTEKEGHKEANSERQIHQLGGRGSISKPKLKLCVLTKSNGLVAVDFGRWVCHGAGKTKEGSPTERKRGRRGSERGAEGRRKAMDGVAVGLEDGGR